MWAARNERDESQRDVIAAGFASLGRFKGSVQALSMKRVPALLFAGTEDQLADLTWAAFITVNLVPVTIGNIIGGAVLVGAVYWFVFLRPELSKAP
jgi:formate/nitrite transporter FocA (FNT family)